MISKSSVPNFPGARVGRLARRLRRKGSPMRTFTALLMASVFLFSAAGHAQDDPALRTGWIHNPATRFAIERATRGAMDRLDKPECRQVLSEFRDSSGRTIEESLDALGETPRGYLARITFHEGRDTR